MKTKNVFLFMMVIGWTVLAGNDRGIYLYAQPETAKVTAEPDVDYKAQDYRDPFDSNIDEMPVKQQEVPVVAAQETVMVKPPELEIQGIFWGSSYAQAIIDNTVVKAGDTIKGAKITAISKDGVKILFSGKEFSVSAPGGNSQAAGKAGDKKKKSGKSTAKKSEKAPKKAVGEAESDEENPAKASQADPKDTAG